MVARARRPPLADNNNLPRPPPAPVFLFPLRRNGFTCHTNAGPLTPIATASSALNVARPAASPLTGAA
ncbi:hypothetical protein EVAR_41134_1 [Eumeta japonica]|uniref:Uncharacterized protein n=1 Tax=Eumeta variegata TaxID=151549 RepID=A0A4C1YAB7_EUMVA|nr:hypothetical protein EVAR_41134_1 [Eumeta japonica]